MLARVCSAAVRGVEGFMVGVELDLSNGLPGFTTVGLPDNSVRESRQRVFSALRHSGFELPARRTTVNLSPAQWRKEGTHFDLPIGLALLLASGQLGEDASSEGRCFLGELGLGGELKPVPGVLPMALAARASGVREMVLPAANVREAAAAGLRAIGVRTLREAAGVLRGALPEAGPEAGRAAEDAGPALDMAEVRGQALARRAVELAAAGGHNLLLIGPPGSGKSMLARRLAGLLPPPDEDEAFEITRIHSVCGLLPAGAGLLRRRPLRAPHPGVSPAALIGGGAACRPGEISLAHKGVLFLDELAEFPRECLEALRQPLEEGRLMVSRLKDRVEYPADFLFVGAMNPCPCGYLGHPRRACRCPAGAAARYRGKVSGPLLDRVDLRAELSPVPFADWAREDREEGSEAVRARVQAARAAARERGGAANGRLSPAEARAACALDSAGWDFLEGAARRLCLSPRGLDRLLRVARTAADLAGEKRVRRQHLAEAAAFRVETPVEEP